MNDKDSELSRADMRTRTTTGESLPGQENSAVPIYRFEELAQGTTSVIRITCAGTEYCLRRTKAGKLVLNK